MRKTLILSILLILNACTISRHAEIYAPLNYHNKTICIIEEPKSIMSNSKSPRIISQDSKYYKYFMDQLYEELNYNDFIITSNRNKCYYTLRFSATYDWDLVNYISDLKLYLYHNEQKVANATYHATGGNSNALLWYKYRRPKTIIRSLLNKLNLTIQH